MGTPTLRYTSITLAMQRSTMMFRVNEMTCENFPDEKRDVGVRDYETRQFIASLNVPVIKVSALAPVRLSS